MPAATKRRRSDAGPSAADKGAIDLVVQLMAIPGPSGQENAVAEFITGRLAAAGLPARYIRFDRAHRRTPIDGRIGNLVVRLPGTRSGPRRMLVAHMDTVPICVGCRPVQRGEVIESSDSQTGLGADDRAGCAVLLSTVLDIVREDRPHPPLTFLWTVQEEIGLHGARHVRQALLGKPKLAFNWDGGAPDKLTIGATGGYRMTITVRGLASHAGGAPEHGISAIGIAALAIADLQQNGWHGDVQINSRHGTSNVGTIEGGSATNVVADRVVLKAEARSHDRKFREKIVRRIERAFGEACRNVRSAGGARGSVEIDGRLDYEAFKLPDNEPCVLVAEEAIRAIGRQPLRAITNGGLDANWLAAHGIPTVTLGCGQRYQHTVSEQLDIADYLAACQTAAHLARGE